MEKHTFIYFFLSSIKRLKSQYYQFEKSIEVRFNRSKIFLAYFYDMYDVNL